jgi:hypothetical protein
MSTKTKLDRMDKKDKKDKNDKNERFSDENVHLGIYETDENENSVLSENELKNQSVPTLTNVEDSNTITKLVLDSTYKQNTHLLKMMILQQKVLNKRIGTQAWKKYLSAAFWNYITTPINFSITLLTAIATGQAATSNILSQQQTLIILFVTFVLTTTNSFFKLNTKMNLNFEAARRYYSFGAEFERIYYTPMYTDLDVKKKLEEYDALHRNVNKYMVSETIENQNYITELIYVVINWATCCACLGNISHWVEENDRNSDLEGGKKDYSIKKRLDYFIRSALGQTAIEMNEIKKDVVFLEEQFAKQKANIEEQKTTDFNLEVVLSEHKKRINELELELATISKKNREEKKASQKDTLLPLEADNSTECQLVVPNKE